VRSPAAGTELTFADLIAHLRAQQIASFKLPERLEIMESFRSALPERF
jgi:non-ribosomal peptide synthetase component E (peptide arylation enzyme)